MEGSNLVEEKNENKESKKLIDLAKSCIKNIKNVDLIGDDIQAAKNHGKAQRLLRIDKDILKQSKGKSKF